MNEKRKPRRTAGFTLTEMLITVVVLAILSAVAVPGVIALQRSLKITELNAAARDIFVAVQDNLTGLKAADRLGTVRGAQAGGDPQLSCVTWQDPLIDQLLPEGAIEATVRGGQYTILYNWAFGVVLDVWYAEADLPDGGTLLNTLRGQESNDARREARIGYYAGETVTMPEGKLPGVELAVQNGEELLAMVRVGPVLGSVLPKAELCLTLRAEDGTEEVLELSAANATLNMVEGTATVVLDSLVENRQFRLLHPAFIPGEDLTLTASLKPEAGSALFASVSDPVQCNSLFAGVSNGKVGIANARHLQNLHAAFSGIRSNDGEGLAITAAVQTADIVWPAALYTLIPIDNRLLQEYDGGSYFISNLTADDQRNAQKNYGVGLFGTIENAALRNVTLIDPRITLGNNRMVYCAGTLAGEAINVSIDNCAVYATGSGEAGEVDYDGLTDIGITVNSPLETLVGGLVGSLAKGRITDSFAALPSIEINSAAGVVGGLAGAADGAINNSYAAVDQLRGRAAVVGGFVGRSTSVEGREAAIESSYAVGNYSVEAATYYGFMGGNGTVRDAYCAITYLTEAGDARPEVRPRAFTLDKASDCAYLESTGVNYQSADKATALSGAKLAVWKNNDIWTKVSATLSNPYQQALDREAYPYPALRGVSGRILAHYGSWPVTAQGREGLVYWELYRDGSYGFYGLDRVTGEKVISLKGNEVEIQEAGYGYILPEGTKGADLPKLAINEKWGEIYNALLPAGRPLDNGEVLYLFSEAAYRELKENWEGTGRTLWIRDKNNVNLGSYFVNLSFAAAMVTLENKATLGTAKVPLQVRTQAQLASVGCNMSGTNILLRQTHNIAVNADWTPVESIRNAGRTLDGTGQVISGLPRPLYGNFEGASGPCTLKGLTLVQADIAADGSEPAGILANRVASNYIVTGCTVRNSKIAGAKVAGFVGTAGSGSRVEECAVEQVTVNSAASAGIAAGFVVRNEGSIKGCHVSPAASGPYEGLTVKATGNNGRAAGFAAETITGISECYAVGVVQAPTGEAAGFLLDAGGNRMEITASYSNCRTSGRVASGFVIRANNVVIGSCYALLTVEGSETAYGFVGKFSGGSETRSCYAAAAVNAGTAKSFGFSPLPGGDGSVKNCYYLDHAGYTLGAGTALAYGDMTRADMGFSNSAAWTDPTADRSHPYNATLGDCYPFPMLRVQEHYGDWPTGIPKGLMYFEQYDGSDYGLYGLKPDGSVLNTLDQNNSYDIQSARNGTWNAETYNLGWGYGVRLSQSQLPATVAGANGKKLTIVAAAPAVFLKNNEKLYVLSDEALEDLADFDDGTAPRTMTITVTTNGGERFIYAANLNFAAAIAPTGTTLGTASLPLQIRTAEQFENIGENQGAATVKDYNDCRFAQTHDILAADIDSVDDEVDNFRYDGRNNRFLSPGEALFEDIGQRAAVFNVRVERAQIGKTESETLARGILADRNAGTVENCQVLDSKLTVTAGGAVAGLVGKNTGTITDCVVRATGSYDGSEVSHGALRQRGNAFGFVAKNSGTIHNSLFAGTVSGGDAAGFAGENTGTITSCYANAQTTAVKTAAGFALENKGTINSCYAVGQVKQTASSGQGAAGFAWSNTGGALKTGYAATRLTGAAGSYGFAPVQGGSVANCVYTVLSDIIPTGTDGGRQILYAELTQLGGALGADFQRATALRSHPFDPLLGTTYPFPMINTLDHYGDWGALKEHLIVLRYTKKADGSYTAFASAMEGMDNKGNRVNVGEVALNFYVGPVTFHGGSPGQSGFALLDRPRFISQDNVKIEVGTGGRTPEQVRDAPINSVLGGVSSECYLFPGNASELVIAHGKNKAEWSYRFTANPDGNLAVEEISAP